MCQIKNCFPRLLARKKFSKCFNFRYSVSTENVYWYIKWRALTIKDCGFQYMISNIWLELSSKGAGCLSDGTIQDYYKWNRIRFQNLMQKVRISYAICGYKNKKNILDHDYRSSCVKWAQKRWNILDDRKREAIVAMEWWSYRCSMYNHPWQIRHECNDRYVFNNEDNSRSFKLICCVQIARQFFSFTTIEE